MTMRPLPCLLSIRPVQRSTRGGRAYFGLTGEADRPRGGAGVFPLPFPRLLRPKKMWTARMLLSGHGCPPRYKRTEVLKVTNHGGCYGQRVFSLRRDRNGRNHNGRGRRSVSLSSLPGPNALYIRRAGVYGPRPAVRGHRDSLGKPRHVSRLGAALAIAGRVIFYCLLAIWTGIAFGLLLEQVLKVTR